MRPRLALLLGALVVPALPLVTAAPAVAAGPYIICVNRPGDAECLARPATIPAAITVAALDGLDSVIRIGPGTYTDGPYVFDGSSSPLTVQGSNNGTGANATVLQASAAGPYATATEATVRNLRITLSGSGGEGLAVSGVNGLAQNVIVSDTPQTAPTNAVGIRATGAKVQGSTVNLVRGAGNTGVVATNAVVSRSTTRTSSVGVVVGGGTLAVDNTLLDLDGAGTVGLRAGTEASTADVTVDARHLTVVGGTPAARGVWAFSDDAAVAATVTLANSIVRSAASSVAATATAGSAVVNVSYSDVHGEQETGTGTVNADPATTVDVDPAFLDPAADYQLRSGSPVVDKGNPLVTTGNDRNDEPRAFDGDGNGSPIPDLGAYELHDITAPRTTITSGPVPVSSDNTPLFQFKASEDDVTFQCQLDGGSFQGCSSPVTTTPLADGTHTFAVRASDAFFNVESPAVTRSFTVDTTAPATTLTKKPQKRFFKQKVKFKFVSSEAGRFQCQLDKRPWRSCSSPYRYSVKVGKHRLLVRAVDTAGNVDPTPARYKFKRLKRHRHR